MDDCKYLQDSLRQPGSTVVKIKNDSSKWSFFQPSFSTQIPQRMLNADEMNSFDLLLKLETLPLKLPPSSEILTVKNYIDLRAFLITKIDQDGLFLSCQDLDAACNLLMDCGVRVSTKRVYTVRCILLHYQTLVLRNQLDKNSSIQLLLDAHMILAEIFPKLLADQQITQGIVLSKFLNTAWNHSVCPEFDLSFGAAVSLVFGASQEASPALYEQSSKLLDVAARRMISLAPTSSSHPKFHISLAPFISLSSDGLHAEAIESMTRWLLEVVDQLASDLPIFLGTTSNVIHVARFFHSFISSWGYKLKLFFDFFRLLECIVAISFNGSSCTFARPS
jgi:hypothetical protein